MKKYYVIEINGTVWHEGNSSWQFSTWKEALYALPKWAKKENWLIRLIEEKE